MFELTIVGAFMWAFLFVIVFARLVVKRREMVTQVKLAVASSWATLLLITFLPAFGLVALLPLGFFVGKTLAFKFAVSLPTIVWACFAYQFGRIRLHYFHMKRFGEFFELE